MSKVIVFGGAGFVGSHTVDALIQQGHSVLVFDDLSTGNLENLTEVTGPVTVYEEDIVNYPDVLQKFHEFRPDAVIHLAAQAAISTSIEDPVRDLEVNAIGTLNILRAANKVGVRNFVFASTSAVYKEIQSEPDSLKRYGQYGGPNIKEGFFLGPNTPYGISKLAAESYVRLMFPSSVVLRFGNILGPRQVPIGENQVLSRMIRHFKYGDEFYIHGSGQQKRDFIYVSDVVSAILASLDGKPGIYNIATGEAHSVNEIAKIVETRYQAIGYPWEHTKEEDPRTHVCLDITSAKEGLGWEPKVKLFQAVVQTIDWWELAKKS